MTIFTIHHPLEFSFGILGNMISFMVFLAPLPTFYRIYKNKSTQEFQSLPYVVALFSSTLWMYYAFLKTDVYLLITINSFGCVIETIYISIFIAYAPRKARIVTAKILVLLNVGIFSLIILFTILLAKGSNRVRALGWICVVFSTCVFAAPLSILRLVIRTKSVEFMPFWLSFFLTISAVSWFSYGFVLKDIYIAIPNILGFVFGVVQMILYFIYKDNKKTTVDEKNTSEPKLEVIKLSTVLNSEEHIIYVQPRENEDNMGVDQKVMERTRANEIIVESVMPVGYPSIAPVQV